MEPLNNDELLNRTEHLILKYEEQSGQQLVLISFAYIDLLKIYFSFNRTFLFQFTKCLKDLQNLYFYFASVITIPGNKSNIVKFY